MRRKLFKYAFSVGFEKESVLFLQILLMSILLFMMADPLLENLNTYREVTVLYSDGQQDLIHVIGENAPTEDDQIHAFSVSHAVAQKASTQSDQALDALLLHYSKSWMSQINLQTDGIETAVSKDAIPVLLSEACRNNYALHEELSIWLAEENITCTGEVVGFFRNHRLPVLMSHGSLPRLNDFYLSVEDYPAMVALESIEGVSCQPEYLITPGNPETFEASTASSDDVSGSSVRSDILGAEIRQTWNTYFMDNASIIFAFALFLLVAVFGFGAYIALVFREKQDTMRILHLNGLSYRSIRQLFITAYGFLVGIPLLIGWLLIPLIGKVIFLEGLSLPKLRTVLLALALMGLLLWTFTSLEFRRFEKNGTAGIVQAKPSKKQEE